MNTCRMPLALASAHVCTHTRTHVHELRKDEGDSCLQSTHQSPSARFLLCVATHARSLWPADTLPGPHDLGQEVSFSAPLFSLETLNREVLLFERLENWRANSPLWSYLPSPTSGAEQTKDSLPPASLGCWHVWDAKTSKAALIDILDDAKVLFFHWKKCLLDWITQLKNVLQA